MTVIKWRDAYNTGIVQFDQEHHKLVALIDRMFFAIRDGSSKEITEQICADILAYTNYHFTNEEQAMRSAEYPDIDHHIGEHERLKTEAIKHQTTINRKFPEGRAEFYRLLREWLIQHIQNSDKKYGPYLTPSE